MKKSIVFSIVFLGLSLFSLNAQSGAVADKNSSDKKGEVSKDTVVSVINEILFSVGTNLNFVSTTQRSGLYYDINAFIPSLNKRGGRFGMDVRLNQGKLIPNIDTSSSRSRYFTTQNFDNQDTIDVLRQDYRTRQSEDLSHLTLSISPTVRLGKETFIYAAGHFEYRKLDRISETKFITEEETMLRFTENDVNSINLSSINLLNRDIRIETVQHNFNYGLGAKLFIELGKTATLNIKAIMGYGDKGESKGMFYLTHFEAIENKLGFKIGGELRGITKLGKGELSRQNIQDFEPDVGLYVAKSFKLSKIYELLNL